ncbi:MAG: Bug family tripartite tricarboxylate transporter substrate binding protein [Gemmatimonas sp.]
MIASRLSALATLTALAALMATPSRGAAGQEFFAGKTVDLFITQDAGSGYDLYARLMADSIVRFLPGKPTIVPRNMQGAGGMRVMQYLYKVAPKDGTAWGAVDRGVAVEPILYGKDSKAPYKDPLEFNWIGSLNTEVGVAAVWHTTGIKSWEELRTRPTIVSMANSQGGFGARALNAVLGTKFRQVCCYGSDSNQNLAMERGEVEGRVGWSWSSLRVSSMEWLQTGKIKLLMQVGLQKNKDIPADVPLVLDLAQGDKDKAAITIMFANQSMGRPFLMPPGVPAERVAEVRRAFVHMVKDPEFLAAAEKRHLEINDPKTGEEVEELLKKVYSSAPDAIDAAQSAVTEGEVKMIDSPKK